MRADVQAILVEAGDERNLYSLSRLSGLAPANVIEPPLLAA
jgi:hypothetical protein